MEEQTALTKKEIKQQQKILRKQEKAEKKKQKKENKAMQEFQGKFNSFFADFKKFISKGNIIDLSVAVVIGAAFNKITSSLVNDIIMPLISLLTGGVSVADWKWVIKPATYDSAGVQLTAETALRYGVFIQALIDFLIIAFTIFVMLKIIVNSERGFKSFASKFKKKHKLEQQAEQPAPAPAPEPKKIESQEDILRDIRTLLASNTAKNVANTNEQKKD